MGIGIGIFLGLVFLGTIYLYTQTRETWNWRKIWKRIGIGFALLIAVPIFIALCVSGYESFSGYLSNRPKVHNSLRELKLGEKFSDVSFKLPITEDKEGPTSDEITYYMIDKQKDWRLGFNKDRVLTTISEGCFDTKDDSPPFERVNGIGCGSTGEDILNKYGKNMVRIQCEKNPTPSLDKTKPPEVHRVYDVVDYGVRHVLSRNYTYIITIAKPSDLKGWSGLNWIPCDEAEKLEASKK